MGALPRLLPLVAAMLLAAPASHAQWTVTPSVSLLETYTDNVDLRDDELANAQWITEVRPSLSVSGESRRLKVNAFGSWNQYVYNDKDKVLDPIDSQLRYSANLQGTLVEQMLYVDARANRSRQSILPFGPGAQSNRYSYDNQTDVKSWSVSPYLVRRLGRDATMQVRYTRDSVDAGLDRLFGSSTGDTVLLNLASSAELRTLGWGLSYVRQDIDNRLVGESSSENINASLRYQFSRAWTATATAGRDTYDFEGPGPDSSGNSWSVGGIWTPSQRTRMQASIGRHLYGQTGMLSATVRARRMVWDIQYGDTIGSSRSQYLLPAAVDTAAMLDRLFNSMFPDALERERAVAAYMLANGLPPSMANDINYLSNRFTRSKELRASVGWRAARTTALLSAYRSERTALSDQQSDSPLLGSSLSSLNDNVRQHGASVNVSYRLGARSDLSSGANYRYTESLTTGVESRERLLFVRLHRDLGRHLKAGLEVQRRTGGTEFTGRRDYTEHAVVANLTMTY